jgi:hypothetical protein
LRQLLSSRPELSDTQRDLCFNGPVDYDTGDFYISNVFQGDGRFASRYLLCRGRRRFARPRPSADDGVSTASNLPQDVIDVELVAPPIPNLNYIVPRFPTGCGFEARYSHAYRLWISPGDIDVRAEGERVVYAHAITGHRLRMHYRGFMLAQFLPSEYQLLLAGHGDAFVNPFLRDPAVTLSGLQHQEELRYGVVYLRREAWDVAASLLRQQVHGPTDELRRAAELRAWMRDNLRSDVDQWYYSLYRSGGAPGKPRLIDLSSPVSSIAFSREVTTNADGLVISFSPMAPGVSHLSERGGVRFMTEHMLEV